jgi:hypothetical protein
VANNVTWFPVLDDGDSAGKASAFSFSFDTQHLELFYQVGSMSNAESDRKPDGSAEDDDEPDEWCVWLGGDSRGGLEVEVECELTSGQGHEDLQHGLCRGEHQIERLLL